MVGCMMLFFPAEEKLDKHAFVGAELRDQGYDDFVVADLDGYRCV